MVLTNGTYIHQDKFKQLCESLHVKPIIRVLTPNGRAKEGLFTVKSHPDVNSGHSIALHQQNLSFKCMCSLNNKLYISIDESLYSCFLLNQPQYYLGTLDELLVQGINKIEIKPIIDTIPQCKNCEVRYFCASPCPGHDSVVYNNPPFINEICSRNYQYLNKVVWNS